MDIHAHTHTHRMLMCGTNSDVRMLAFFMLRFLSSNSAFNTFKNTEDNKMKNKLNLNFFLFLKSCFEFQMGFQPFLFCGKDFGF